MQTSDIKIEDIKTEFVPSDHSESTGKQLQEDATSQLPTLDNKSRKIHKKREKYKKINDDIRLQLLEAVNKNGELLKTVNF